MIKLEKLDEVKYSTFIVLNFKVHDGESVWTVLSGVFCALGFMCDIVGVAHHGLSECSAVFRRTRPRTKFNLPATLQITITNLYAFRLQGKTSAQVADLTFQFVQAWGQTGGELKVNFMVELNVIWTNDQLITTWSQLTEVEIQKDILNCKEKVRLKRKPTSREIYVSLMGREVSIYMAGVRAPTNTSQEMAANPDLMSLESFDHLDHVVCRTFDVVTGALIQYPVSDWLRRGWFKSHTLILHGDAGLGKTPLAMTLLSEVATHLQADCPWAPYFLKVGTVESLRDAASTGLMKSKIPILFDDLSPDQASGTSKGMPLHALKLILEVTQSSGFSARFKDLVFASEEPRIFTANALNPCQWHKGLPTDPFFACSDASRRALDLNVKAAFKRSCFAFVGHALVGEAAREQHQRARLHM